MKNYKIFNHNRILILFASVSIFVIQSCSKYGYNFADGYNGTGGDSAVITVDTTLNKPDFTMYAQASIYPGLVEDTVTRLQNMVINFDLNFTKNPDKLRISTLPQPWLSSGVYAPTGEPITVIVPEGVYGLTAQIGAQTDNKASSIAKYGADFIKREAQIYTRQQLYPGTNYIRSPFGGPIYIIPQIPQQKIVPISFTGVVKMADFVLGQSNPNDWAAEISKSGVPWFELRAPHIIFTCNTEKAIRLGKLDPSLLTNVELLMTEWEKIFNIDYTEWVGLSATATDDLDKAIAMPWRCVADIGMDKGVAAHSGFPVVYMDSDHWFRDFIMNYETLINHGSWGILHEVGHNMQQSNWSFSGMGETTNNLFSFKTANRLGYTTQDSTWTKKNATLGYSIMNWVALTDTSAGKKVLYGASATAGLSDMPIEKCLLYIQLFEEYGYGLMTELYKQTRHADHTSVNDQDRVDFIFQVACAYAKQDLYVFFKMWGITPSSQARAVVAAIPGITKLTKKIWTYNPTTKKLNDTSPIIY